MATIVHQSVRSPAAGQPHESLPLEDRAATALDAAVQALLSKLRADGQRWGAAAAAHEPDRGGLHWCAELEGDSILSSEYLLMKLILGQENDTEGVGGRRVGRPTLLRIANHLRLTQRDDGTWGQYPGSGPDISACVKAYLALKCFGDSADAPHMQRARNRIIALGGAERCNTFSTFYLACLGQVSWDACPAIPPEIVLLPRWFPFHMDKVAAWTRTMILPLAICSALRPVRELPREWGIDELFVDKRYKSRLSKEWEREEPVCWKNFFLACDRFLKVVRRFNLSPLRAASLKRAEAWILDRVRPETTEGLGAIFPPMVYLQVAFKALGYEREHPVMARAERDLDDFCIEGLTNGNGAGGGGTAGTECRPTRQDHVRLQPCFSPVWDTGIALYALTEAGRSMSDPRIARVCDWLLAHQVRMNGDWERNLLPEDRGVTLGSDDPLHGAAGWAFEYRNEWYPDNDDTAMVAKSLWRAASHQRAGTSSERHATSSGAVRSTAARSARWLLAMQNDDGGWAAFDRTVDRAWMEAIPFADHNAMQDPSCADITGRTIEALVTCGVPKEHPKIRAAVRYLLGKQEPEGCWWGRWGVNYLYGTWQALGGLMYAGFDPGCDVVQRAVRWVLSVQNDDGGFGESANSYLDRSLMGRGPSTASQTAWGLMCLLYALRPDHEACRRAVQWLCDHQLIEDKASFAAGVCTAAGVESPGSLELAPGDFVHDRAGSWAEHWFTGTGFPKVFYLRYNMYRHYFPVMALARWVRMSRGGEALGV
ncbi:MAG: hypothetical protein KF699_12585 [Phycisphaeraceae bacterium]|nr:hypothetical protein [Phycisphaeraceae bacterium]